MSSHTIKQINKKLSWLYDQIRCLKDEKCCTFSETALGYDSETNTLNATFANGDERSVVIVMENAESVTGVASYQDDVNTDISPLSVLANTKITVPIHANINWTDQIPNDIETFFYSAKVTVADASSFEIGESVAEAVGGGQGDIVAIIGNDLLLVNTNNNPFNGGENLFGSVVGLSTVSSFSYDFAMTGREGDGLLFTFECWVIPTSPSTTYVETSVDIAGVVGEIYPRLFTFPKGQGIVRPISFSIGGYTLDTWESNGGQIKIIGNGTFNLYGARVVLTRTHKAR